MILQYVDDLPIFNKEDVKIEPAIQDLKKVFNLKDMSNVTDFLGVRVEEKDNKIKLT